MHASLKRMRSVVQVHVGPLPNLPARDLRSGDHPSQPTSRSSTYSRDSVLLWRVMVQECLREQARTPMYGSRCQRQKYGLHHGHLRVRRLGDRPVRFLGRHTDRISTRRIEYTRTDGEDVERRRRTSAVRTIVTLLHRTRFSFWDSHLLYRSLSLLPANRYSGRIQITRRASGFFFRISSLSCSRVRTLYADRRDHPSLSAISLVM